MASDRGKKIDVWEFVVNHVKVSVPVKLRATGRYGDTSDFFVRDETLSLSDHDSDINLLKSRVQKHLSEHLRVEWERFFYIEFRGDLPRQPPEPDEDVSEDDDSDQDGLSVGIESRFQVTEIEIGEKPDGSKCWRKWNKYGSSRSSDGLPETGRDTDRWESRPAMRCYVPATKENRAAIEKLRDAFLLLHGRLSEFLSPEMVVGNLGKASKLLRLESTMKQGAHHD